MGVYGCINIYVYFCEFVCIQDIWYSCFQLVISEIISIHVAQCCVRHHDLALISVQLYFSARMQRKNGQFASSKDSFTASVKLNPNNGTAATESV